MKNITFVLANILFVTNCIFSQNTVNTGGNFSRSLGGNLTSSIGQIFSKNIINDKNSLKEGMLHVVKKDKNNINPLLFDKIVKIYPNPTSSILMIELNKDMINCSNYRLMNTIGETIKNDNINTLSTQLDLTYYANGVYFLDINYKGKTLNYKIIKN